MQEHQIAAHEQLYQDATRRRLRQEEMAHWFPEDVTFQPTLETQGHQADSTQILTDTTLSVCDRQAVHSLPAYSGHSCSAHRQSLLRQQANIDTRRCMSTMNMSSAYT